MKQLRASSGAKQADLPIEQPVKYELVVNVKTAKAIGLELPTSLLLRAGDPFFLTRRVQLAILAARHVLPTCFDNRGYAEAGGR